MRIELEKQDINSIASAVAELVFEKQKDNLNSSLVDIDGLADYLKVTRSWIYDKTRDKSKGSIPRVMVGKYVRFNVQDVLEWLKRQ